LAPRYHFPIRNSDAAALRFTMRHPRQIHRTTPKFNYIPFDHFLAEVQMQVALHGTEIALLLETGDHRIVTESKLSLLRRTALLLTGLALLLILGLRINQEFRNT